MSLRSSGSETEIKDFIVADYRPEMKSESGMVDDKTSEDVPNRFDKQSVSYGCDPELPDFHHPVKSLSYIGKFDKSLHGCELENEDKLSVSYGCDPEIKQMIPDFNHPVEICSYIGTSDKSLLAEELGCKPKTKGITCVICSGEKHDMFTCKFLERCPFDKKVGEDFEVVCLCSRMDCTERCSYPIGRVKFKHPSSCLKY